MPAPAHTAITTRAGLQAVGGIEIPEGFKSVLVFARLALALFYCEKVTPGGLRGGDPLNMTSQLNLKVMTALPRKLRKEDDSTVVANYDAKFKQQIRDTLLNQNGSVTEYLPDGSYEDFYGFMYDATFADFVIGEVPKVTFKVCKSNLDATNLEVEPVLTLIAGT